MVSGMNTKNAVEVVINGNQYTLCGYESNEYLQQIANHINEKYTEFKQQEGYSRLDTDMKNILLAINLTDDYYKAREQAGELQQQTEDLEKELFEMKHELIDRQTRIEELEKELAEQKQLCEESRNQMIRLEAELERPVGDTEAAATRDNKNGGRRNYRKADNGSGQKKG